MSVSQHTIAGTVLTMPVRIRKADNHTAMFSVDAGAAQRLIDYSGLRVCEHRPGRAVVALLLVRYIDGDLGQYHEFGTAVMVNPQGSQDGVELRAGEGGHAVGALDDVVRGIGTDGRDHGRGPAVGRGVRLGAEPRHGAGQW